MPRTYALRVAFLARLLSPIGLHQRVIIILSHVVNLELVFKFVMGVKCDGALFGQLVAFLVFVYLDVALSLDLLPVTKRRDWFDVLIAHDEISM